MSEENTVAVVIPAFDEAGFVGEVIDTTPDFVDRIYPVDDRSTDETWAEIRPHARRANEQAAESGPVADDAGDLLPPDDAESPGSESTEGNESADATADGESFATRRVVPLRHDENRGVGAAIKTGYRRASADGIDAVAVMAGDGQMDPDYLSRILDPVVSGRGDYAKGDRLAHDEFTDEMSNWPLFGNGLLTLLTRAASGYWSMTDPQNGYTAITSEALDAVFHDYGFANAMLVLLNVADMRVADVPMPARYGDEDSGIRYSAFVPQLSALLAKGFEWRLAEEYRREFRPVRVCYAFGVVGTLVRIGMSGRDLLGRNQIESTPSSDRRNPKNSEENEYNAETTEEDSQTPMNTATTERPRGRGPLPILVGLAATALAVVFDAAENEPLHVAVDADDPAETEENAPESDREVSDR